MERGAACADQHLSCFGECRHRNDKPESVAYSREQQSIYGYSLGQRLCRGDVTANGSGGQLNVGVSSDNTVGVLLYQGSANQVNFKAVLNATGIAGLPAKNLLWQGSSYASDMAFSPSTAAPAALVLKANGSVGIGTTSPQHLLQVAGTISAKEVIVSSTGADYVFQPGYTLKSLSETFEYIQEHRHLPDIPPAADVQRNGMNVGEMQTRLLAKIEELTLQMIGVDARNQRLEQENRDLEERLARLEAAAGKAEAGGASGR
jgi:hypothetical protein